MIRVYKKPASGADFSDIVQETVIEIKLPWKRKCWSVHDDMLVYQNPTYLLAWYRIPCSRNGYRARFGFVN